MKRMILFTILLCSGFLHTLMAYATPVRDGEVEVELVFDHTQVTPGQTLQAGIVFRHEPHWHSYWYNPGDSGYPAQLHWQLPQGWQAGAVNWPTPHLIPTPPLMSYGYSDTTTLPVPLTIAKDAQPGAYPVTVKVDWLMCADICLPGQATLESTLTVGDTPQENTATHIYFKTIKYPHSPVLATGISYTPTAITLTVDLDAQNQPVRFIPATEGVINDSADQTWQQNGKSLVVTMPRDDFRHLQPDVLKGILLVSDEGYTLSTEGGLPATPPSPVMPTAEVTTLLVALGFALLGGLILNLMPCVLPLLALKVLHIVHHAHKGSVLAHAVAFAVGILATFWALAGVLLVLQQGGTLLGWGFQLQSPVFVLGISILLTLVTLELFGVFEFGTSLTRLGGAFSQASGIGGSAFMGVLTALVATPCTAPFMGAAIAYSLAQPPVNTLAVFTALGLGLAMPYVLLALSPRLLKKLPRPGSWMVTFKQILAFPMLATLVWLAWVYGNQTGADGMALLLVAMVAVALASWIYGQWGQTSETGLGQWLWFLLFAAAIVGIGYSATRINTPPTATTAEAWEAFTPGKPEALQAQGHPVLVVFTADWCITCKVNERLILKTTAMTKLFQEKNLKILEADWTNQNSTIAAELAKYNRKGVPFYLMYPAGGGAPMPLPELITSDIVRKAVEQAAKGTQAQ